MSVSNSINIFIHFLTLLMGVFVLYRNHLKWDSKIAAYMVVLGKILYLIGYTVSIAGGFDYLSASNLFFKPAAIFGNTGILLLLWTYRREWLRG